MAAGRAGDQVVRPAGRHRSLAATVLRRGTVFIFLIGLAAFFSSQSWRIYGTDRFFQPDNLTNILAQNAPIIVVACAVMLTMLVGGIDLSVGSVAAFAGAVSAGLIARNGLPIELALPAALLVGFTLGAVNGALVVYGKLPPFIATLAMLGVARSFTLVYTEGRPISRLGDAYRFIGRGDIGGIPTPVIIALCVVLILGLLLTRTRFGLHIYAIGGNEETARLAGVSVNRVKLLTFGLSGFLAALCGIMLTARLVSAQPQAAVGLELDAITAAVIGGVSLFGGVGNVWGMVIGALLVGVLGNGLNLMRIPSYPQQMIQGTVLIVAVAVDMLAKRIEQR